MSHPQVFSNTFFCLLLIQNDWNKELLKKAILIFIILTNVLYQKLVQEHVKKQTKKNSIISEWVFKHYHVYSSTNSNA